MHQYLKQIIVEAGNMAKDYFLKGVTFKTKTNLGDLVTVADVAVSEFLTKKILAKYPTHQIHSEEVKDDINPGAEFEWIMDPIDGTRNFAKGIPMWCVMVAVYQNQEPLFAAVYNPVSSELFFAKTGEGATLNGMPLKVNDVSSLDYGFGSFSRGLHTTHEANYRKMSDRLNNETTVWVHNFGTMLGACFVAAGGVDFFAINAGLDHDYAAPVLICKEAGALVTDSDGNPWQRGRRDIVIANPKLHPKILELLKL